MKLFLCTLPFPLSLSIFLSFFLSIYLSFFHSLFLFLFLSLKRTSSWLRSIYNCCKHSLPIRDNVRRESKSRGEGKEWECEFMVRHIVYSERLFIIGGRKRDGGARKWWGWWWWAMKMTKFSTHIESAEAIHDYERRIGNDYERHMSSMSVRKAYILYDQRALLLQQKKPCTRWDKWKWGWLCKWWYVCDSGQ